jgi:hypothetical protein
MAQNARRPVSTEEDQGKHGPDRSVVTKPHATLDSGEMLSTAYLREPLRILLGARAGGLGEAMLVHLLRTSDRPEHLGRVAPALRLEPHDSWLRKVRQTCKQLGASRSPEGVWSMPA